MDGKSLVDVTHEEAVAILKSTSNVVRLKICHPTYSVSYLPPIAPYQDSNAMGVREPHELRAPVLQFQDTGKPHVYYDLLFLFNRSLGKIGIRSLV